MRRYIKITRALLPDPALLPELARARLASCCSAARCSCICPCTPAPMLELSWSDLWARFEGASITIMLCFTINDYTLPAHQMCDGPKGGTSVRTITTTPCSGSVHTHSPHTLKTSHPKHVLKYTKATNALCGNFINDSRRATDIKEQFIQYN